MNVVIQDNRDGKLYLDSEPAILRFFETEIETGITEDQAKKKYPGIIDVRRDTTT